MLALLD